MPNDGYTAAQAVSIIANTRADELRKQQCGKALVAWANGVLKTVRGGR